MFHIFIARVIVIYKCVIVKLILYRKHFPSIYNMPGHVSRVSLQQAVTQVYQFRACCGDHLCRFVVEAVGAYNLVHAVESIHVVVAADAYNLEHAVETTHADLLLRLQKLRRSLPALIMSILGYLFQYGVEISGFSLKCQYIWA